MAIINCPECGGEVSSNAEKCPKCSNPISGRQPQLIGQQAAQPKSNTVRNVLLGVGGCLGLCCVFSMISAVISPRPRGPSTSNPGTGGTAQPAPVPAGLVVSPSTLVRDYDGNEVSADLKYKGKVLRVTGSVDDIRKDIMDNMFVTLSSGHAFRQVQVTFEDSEVQRVASLRKGSRVTIQGECDGLMMNVLISDAVFVD